MENLTTLVTHLCGLPHETEWLEFKHNKYNPDMIGADISALANSAALAKCPFAYMIWGVDDKTHDIVGTTFDHQDQSVGDQELDNWLRSLLSDNAEIDFLNTKIADSPMVILRVGKAVNRPVTFKKTAYVRVGSYTKKLHDVPSKQIALWDVLRSSRFETGLAKENLHNEDVVSLLDTQAYFDGIGRPYPSTSATVLKYLADENIIHKQDNGLWAITNLGAMLFAKRLRDFNRLKRKTVRIVNYQGDDRLSASKEEVYESGYGVNFEGLLTLISALVPSHEIIGTALREEQNDYPKEAVREAVANALIHQDLSVTGAGPMIEIFAHRMEITNPGSLTVDPMRIIDTPPQSRNEDMASLMRRMKICEERGTGWDKIANACELAELPSAKIRNYENGTRVILYTKRPFSRISEEDREWACYMHACLRYVNESEETTYMTNGSLRQRFGLEPKSQPTISKLIKKTGERGLIRPLDPDASPRYKKYVPTWA
ncbi:ATP-binding protein [Bifidobacterium sp. ESL0790]|uniref:ATP-binding protein n=1 Tax=Bifidobacterium sp. ESL0790 TaxID=2983233 RepID=UPI0023F8B116|nr:ATP-binding protein [Bifidobacterium sp. ESL0790]WEV72388.1 putative DNA binding domain-containing protein [Bifidobacterium sp. ESL0790]